MHVWWHEKNNRVYRRVPGRARDELVGHQKKAGAHIRLGSFLFSAQGIHRTVGLLVASVVMGCFSSHWPHRTKSKSWYLCRDTGTANKMRNEAWFSGVLVTPCRAVCCCEANCCTACCLAAKQKRGTAKSRTGAKPNGACCYEWRWKNSRIMKKDAAASTQRCGLIRSLYHTSAHSLSVPISIWLPPLLICSSPSAGFCCIFRVTLSVFLYLSFSHFVGFLSPHPPLILSLSAACSLTVLSGAHQLIWCSRLEGLVLPSSWAFKPCDLAITHWSHPVKHGLLRCFYLFFFYFKWLVLAYTAKWQHFPRLCCVYIQATVFPFQPYRITNTIFSY